MNQMQGLHVKCSIEQHEFLELVCLNKLCKANRVYCHQCIKNGDHIAHPKDQKNLIELIQFFHQIEQESENLISKLCFMVEEIKELTIELNQQLRKKYQFSKERLQQLNAKQLNQALDQIILFDEIKISLLNELETCSDNMVNQLKRQITDLKLEPLNNDQLNKQQQEQAEELHKKGYKLYYDDDKYEEAIKVLDVALLINLNHLESLYIKAECLHYLSNYNDAIIWAEKALSIDSKHVCSLRTKGQSLHSMGKYEEALKIFDQALNCNPNCFFSFYTKGMCLQSLQKYEEAIVYYNKSIQINPNFSLSLQGKAECEKQINKQQ